MALSVSTQVSPIGSKIVIQTDSTGTVDANVTGAAAVLFMVDVDNSANAAEDAYLKLYNAAAPTIGTTDPEMVVCVLQGTRRQFVIPEGTAFGSGISMATVTTSGTPGTTKLGSAVIVRLVCQ